MGQDHGPGLIAMDTGCEGGMLHGNFDNAPYFYREGKIFTGLTVVEFLLADEGPGDGGVALIPGSHKANLSCPPEMSRWEQYQDFVLEVNAKAGDAIIFSEACTHGTLPWNGAHQRRARRVQRLPPHEDSQLRFRSGRGHPFGRVG